MNVSDILDLARGICGDTRQPYLWQNAEFLQYYNRSVDDVCRRVKHLRDSSTASICQIRLLSGVHTYAYSPKIVELISAKPSNNSQPLTRTTEYIMDQEVSGWKSHTGTPRKIIPEIERNKIRIYPYFEGTYVVEGNSDIGFDSATKTISKASGLSIFTTGDEISITGTTSNGTDAVPKVVTAVTVLDTAITVSETLTDEADTSAVLRRVEDILELSVARLPLTWVKLLNVETEEPPVDEDYHLDFIHGILGYAYMKEGTETYDPQASMKQKGLFEVMIAKIKREQINKTYVMDTCGPNPGAT